MGAKIIIISWAAAQSPTDINLIPMVSVLVSMFAAILAAFIAVRTSNKSERVARSALDQAKAHFDLDEQRKRLSLIVDAFADVAVFAVRDQGSDADVMLGRAVAILRLRLPSEYPDRSRIIEHLERLTTSTDRDRWARQLLELGHTFLMSAEDASK